MENLKALVYKGNLTPYQRALAKREFEGLIERLELFEKAVKNNAVLPHVVGRSEQFPCLNCGANSWKFIESLDKYRCENCKRLKAR